jgi:large subunit ribosomal protein L4
MTSVQITTPSGQTDGSIELPAEIFDAQSNISVMHQVVVAQLAAARQGTHKAKNRGEVSGGGKKPYRQKGTGRARQGSTRAPQFTGGGTVHGPVPHGYAQRTPKKMKAAALRGALSDRARNGRIHVLSSLVEGEAPSTKTAVSALAAVSTARNVLVVLSRADDAGWKSLRNVSTVHLLAADQLNTYDVLVSDDVVFTRGALDEFLAARGIEGDFSESTTGVTAAGSAGSAGSVDTAIEIEDAPAAVGLSKASAPVTAAPAVVEPVAEPVSVEPVTVEVDEVAPAPETIGGAEVVTADEAAVDEALGSSPVSSADATEATTTNKEAGA